MNAMHKAAEGGHIEVIKYLLPLFGARVHEKTNDSYTMLHLVALCGQMGHCQVAHYLIEEVGMDPQDRDKVCGVPRDCAGITLPGLIVSCTSVCVRALVCAACCDNQMSPRHVCVMQ